MNTYSSEATGFATAEVDSVVPTDRILAEIAMEYPAAMIEEQLFDIDRIAYNIGLVQRYGKPGGRVCDIGGGVGLFSPGCAALGYNTTLVDDFNDEINQKSGEAAFAAHAKHGVKVVSCDVIAGPLNFPENSFDVITTFDSMEHWHHSPKRLFHMLKRALAPSGTLIIGVPNCNNLRKRIVTLFGRGYWSPMRDWYETEAFRAHVREPSVSDLRYICNGLDMTTLVVTGRNWQGRKSYPTLTKLADHMLRVRPGLCSDIYIVAKR